MIRNHRIRNVLVAGACMAAMAAGAGVIARTTAPAPAHANPTLAAPSPAVLFPAPNPTLPTAASPNISDVAERAVESVVNISTTQAVDGNVAQFDPFFTDPVSPFFGRQDPRKAKSLGSGVIVSSDGRVLTNAHVVANAASIRVTLHDHTEVSARLVGSDPRSDVAVLQLEAPAGGRLPALKPLPMGDSSQLRLGAMVLAVGDPFGVGKAVTMGIVSAVGRGGLGIEEYEDFIQTDAAINPGNSGGALVDMNGNLVGINTAILSRSGGYQGIGFAIPTNMARPIMEMLIRDGRVSRGYLGVHLQSLDADARAQWKLTSPAGVVVASVGDDTPAAKAGLAAGDVVTAIDGQSVRDISRLRNLVAMKGAGKVADLEVVRAGKARRIAVTLGELPDERQAAQQPKVQPRGKRIVPRGNGKAQPDADGWRRETIIIHPDGTVERR